VNIYLYKSTTSLGPPLVVSSTLVLRLIRLVGGGRGISRRGSVSVPLVTISGLQVLVLVALGQAIRETGLLQDLGGSRSGDRELGRDVGFGRRREVGDCIGQRFLVNNSRGESALDGVGLVDDICLNPDAGVSGRDNFDIGLGDKVRVDLLDRVRLGQSSRVDRETGGGDGDRQSLSVCDVESLGLHIGLGHSVVDCGRDGLGVSDSEDLGLDRLVGNRHSRRGRTILVCVALVNDDRSLITTPTIVIPPPTLGSALSVVSLFVTITTVHLRVSTTGKGRIRHRFVAARRLGRRGSVLRWRGAVGRRSRLGRWDRIRARTRVTGVRGSGIAATRHLGIRNHLDSQRNLSRNIAHGRENNDERTKDR